MYDRPSLDRKVGLASQGAFVTKTYQSRGA